MKPKVRKNAKVTLRRITQKTVRDICNLKGGEGYVAPNSVSIAQAYFCRKTAWFRAIYADGAPVGFIMINLRPKERTCFLWRLMIDERYQRMGFGRQAILQLINYLKANTKAARIRSSYRPGPRSPRGFYQKLGFREIKMEKWGEMGIVLDLK